MLTRAQLVENILIIAGPLPQKKLQKLAYLAEIRYAEKYGARLSDLSFIRYYYGPYSSDIRNIEDEDDNIVIEGIQQNVYPMKKSKIIAPEKVDKLEPEIEDYLKEVITQYNDKTEEDLEIIADNTEPFRETGNFKDPIDLDGYAKYHAIIGKKNFIKVVMEKDKVNARKGLYHSVKSQ